MFEMKPINQEEIDLIKADFEELIAKNPAMEAYYKLQMDTKIAETIARQRREALEAGGELAERIKAENEALRVAVSEMYSAITEEKLEKARKLQEKTMADFQKYKENLENLGPDLSGENISEKVYTSGEMAHGNGHTSGEMTPGTGNSLGEWTCKCGAKNTGRFCIECGSPRL